MPLSNTNVQRWASGAGGMAGSSRCQAGGGRICVNGNQVKGHDIRWVTAEGVTVLVERKDRSYEAGLADTAEQRAQKVVDEARRSRIPVEPGAARILAVGFQHLVSPEDMEVVDPGYQAALEGAFPEEARAGLPHMVLVEHLGMEPRTGGGRSNFFSPQPLAWEPELMGRVGRLVVRAIGQEALLHD